MVSRWGFLEQKLNWKTEMKLKERCKISNRMLKKKNGFLCGDSNSRHQKHNCSNPWVLQPLRYRSDEIREAYLHIQIFSNHLRIVMTISALILQINLCLTVQSVLEWWFRIQYSVKLSWFCSINFSSLPNASEKQVFTGTHHQKNYCPFSDLQSLHYKKSTANKSQLFFYEIFI
jgi:hypothetical protein